MLVNLGAIVIVTTDVRGESACSNFSEPPQGGLDLVLELELIQTQMTQKPMLRAEVGMRVRCANKASAK